MPLYIMQSGPGGACKVGFTDYPKERMRVLQIGNPMLLTLLHLAPGQIGDELPIQRALMGHRIRGEWFEPVAEIISGEALTWRFEPDMRSRNQRSKAMRDARRIATLADRPRMVHPRARMQPDLHPAAEVALRAYASEGVALAEIGRRLGMHHATVFGWARRLGLTVNRTSHLWAENYQAATAHKNGEPDCNPLAVTETALPAAHYPTHPTPFAETQHKERAT